MGVKPGFVRCPLCSRPVALTPNGLMKIHWSELSKVGAGFHGLSQRCKGSHKKPEDVK